LQLSRIYFAQIKGLLPLCGRSPDASNASRLRMLLTEIDSAASKMALAKISRDPKTVQQCKEHALQTYQTGMHRILDTSMSDQEEQEVWNRLAPIGHWLEAAGLLNG
jgi:hypothetical protein